MDSKIKIDNVDGWLKVIGVSDKDAYSHSVVLISDYITAFYELKRIVVRGAPKDIVTEILKRVGDEYIPIIEMLYAKGFKKYWLWVGEGAKGFVEIGFSVEGKVDSVVKEEIKSQLPIGCKLTEYHVGYYTTWGEIVCQ